MLVTGFIFIAENIFKNIFKIRFSWTRARSCIVFASISGIVVGFLASSKFLDYGW